MEEIIDLDVYDFLKSRLRFHFFIGIGRRRPTNGCPPEPSPQSSPPSSKPLNQPYISTLTLHPTWHNSLTPTLSSPPRPNRHQEFNTHLRTLQDHSLHRGHTFPTAANKHQNRPTNPRTTPTTHIAGSGEHTTAHATQPL